VRGLEDEVSHDDLDIELLLDLAAQRCSVRFAMRNFAAREFPETREVNAALPPCDEKPILPLDDGGDDEDARHCAGL
jgi:hypothetical protein